MAHEQRVVVEDIVVHDRRVEAELGFDYIGLAIAVLIRLEGGVGASRFGLGFGLDTIAGRAGVGDLPRSRVAVEGTVVLNDKVEPGLVTDLGDLPAVVRAGEVDPVAAAGLFPEAIDVDVPAIPAKKITSKNSCLYLHKLPYCRYLKCS
ncbi:hypothetical protein [Allochromatium palmeri]|uniref:Uncharacterized protein n=1 Tax=Allochromatium palmeri TaxID=231048 RepID=A0A6N8EF29_9GAMM|nr:hypothetical protein [Allochromatium palmeri]MTW21246.1 hypothetical protein [Allochromatium palmeri]